jgi:hypothetical protein
MDGLDSSALSTLRRRAWTTAGMHSERPKCPASLFGDDSLTIRNVNAGPPHMIYAPVFLLRRLELNTKIMRRFFVSLVIGMGYFQLAQGQQNQA